MKAINIEWNIDKDDFDNETEYEAVIENLPKEVELPMAFEDLSSEDFNGEVSNYLSNKYGYCVKNFEISGLVSSFCQSLIDFFDERRATVV